MNATRTVRTFGANHAASILAVAILAMALPQAIGCSKKASGPTAPAQAVCSVSPTALDFGSVAAGQVATRTFTVQNTGGGYLSGTVTVPPGSFRLAGPGGYSLNADQSATISVQYFWQHAGSAQSTISTGSGCATVQCTAVGETSPCGVAPASLSFGHVTLGATRDLTFQVTNMGTAEFIATAFDTCADFSFVGISSARVPAGGTVEFKVRFTPTRPGSQTCSISMNQVCTPLVCTGTGDATPCFVTPLDLDFGTTEYGAYVDRSFDIRNDGASQLSGHVVVSSGDNVCGSFLLHGSDGTYNLAPGASRTFTVRCAPRVLRPSLECDISTGAAPCAQIHCHIMIEPPESGTCHGVSFPPDTIDFGSVPIGQTASRTVSIPLHPDCPWPDPELTVLTLGGGDYLAGDFSFDDGSYVQHVSMDRTFTWAPTISFRPTVEGEETLAMECFMVCGPPGSPGAICHTVMGKGVGVRTTAMRRGPAEWKPLTTK